MNVLVTGGAGYIGSHTIVELMAAGHRVVAVDNLVTSYRESLGRVAEITGNTVPFYELDCSDKQKLREVFDKENIDAVIHFAALKSVGESSAQPLKYYRNNLDGLITLCEIMQDTGVRKLVFSSSCTVYGNAEKLPVDETTPVGGTLASPYGRTKYMAEQILRDVATADSSWQIISLRYFNVAGAHESGRIGEDPLGIPNFLLPYISQVAVGRLDKLRVFGNDYHTPDGTCLRDYIHVVDLAKGHVAALAHLTAAGFDTFNLGMGKGVSVLEVIRAFEHASGKRIPYEIVARRPGDVEAIYANASKAKLELGWRATRTIDDICTDTWRWQSQNPNGYRSA